MKSKSCFWKNLQTNSGVGINKLILWLIWKAFEIKEMFYKKSKKSQRTMLLGLTNSLLYYFWILLFLMNPAQCWTLDYVHTGNMNEFNPFRPAVSPKDLIIWVDVFLYKHLHLVNPFTLKVFEKKWLFSD